MKPLLIAIGTIVGLLCVLFLAYLALIEVGQEVVVLRTTSPDGTVKSTRLWIVRHDDAEWLHSAGRDWVKRFEDDPVVELERDGNVKRYHGKPIPGPHPAIESLEGIVDIVAVTRIRENCLQSPRFDGDPVWIHEIIAEQAK